MNIEHRAEPASAYARFVPRHIHLLDDEQRDSLAPLGRRFPAAILTIDIAGYTELTESLAPQGGLGIDRLKRITSTLFTRLERAIFAAGGDIVAFAGDSVISMWPAIELHQELRHSCLRALQCGLDILEHISDKALDRGISLQLRAGVAAGDVALAAVGGLGGHRFCVGIGNAFVEAGVASCTRVAPGSVVATDRALDLVTNLCDANRIGDGFSSIRALRSASSPSSTADGRMRPADGSRAFVPQPVRENIDAGLLDGIAEFRHVTSLMVSVRDFDFDASDSIDRMHRTVLVVQRIVARLKGAMIQVVVDDKGLNIVGVWGVPGFQSEEDAQRAVFAALAIEHEFSKEEIRFGIGIASGRTLCDVTGGERRLGYTVVGNAINRAARLMTEAHESIVCDRFTSDHARSAIHFERLPAVSAKGVSHPLGVERPTGRRQTQANPVDRDRWNRSRTTLRLIGRSAEIELLIDVVDKCLQRRRTIVAIKGEPGIGKTRLLKELASHATERGVNCFIGQGSDVDHSTAYFAWRSVLRQVLAREAGLSVDGQRRYLDRLFTGHCLHGYLAVLEDVLLLAFPENDAISQLSGDARAEAVAELISYWLGDHVFAEPTVLVFDDVQWMDSSSWLLTARLSRQLPGLAIVLAARSGFEPASIFAVGLFQHAHHRITLEPLSASDTHAFMCDLLGVDEIEPEIVRLMYAKTDGHPLFSEELIHQLRDKGDLHIEHGKCRLGNGVDAAAALRETPFMEAVIMGRVDTLDLRHKDTLKVASVAGPLFPAALIKALRGDRLDDREVQNQLKRFEALDLIRNVSENVEPTFAFKHVIIQETIYDLLEHTKPTAAIHEAVASWYEATPDGKTAALYPMLAHHWEKAGRELLARDYFLLGGKHAFARNEYREADGLLTRALALSAITPVNVQQRIDCVRQLGHTKLWLGELAESEAYLRKGLALQDRPIPSRVLDMILKVTRCASVAWLIYLTSGFQGRAVDKAEREEVLDLLRLGHIGYFNRDKRLSFYTSLRQLSFALAAERCAESALIYAAMTLGAAMVGCHPLAKFWRTRAVSIASRIGDAAIAAQVSIWSAMYAIGVGDWKDASEQVAHGCEQCKIVGNRRRSEECSVVSGYLHYFTGDFSRSAGDFRTLTEAGLARGDKQTAGWGFLGTARVLLACDDPRAAIASLERARSLVVDELSRIELYGLLAIGYMRRDQHAIALDAARIALKHVVGGFSSSFSTLTGLAGMTEALVIAYERSLREVQRETSSTLEAEALLAIDQLTRFARRFPIALPQSLLQQGQLERARGNMPRAISLWRKARGIANRMGMPEEEARLALTIANHTTGFESDEAKVHAAALLGRLHASGHGTVDS